MSKANEPAFPEIKCDSNTSRDNGELDADVVSAVWSEGGLTKREYFAGLAMQGIYTAYASPEFTKAVREQARKAGMDAGQYTAAMAVEQADALLAELEKKQ